MSERYLLGGCHDARGLVVSWGRNPDRKAWCELHGERERLIPLVDAGRVPVWLWAQEREAAGGDPVGELAGKLAERMRVAARRIGLDNDAVILRPEPRVAHVMAGTYGASLTRYELDQADEKPDVFLADKMDDLERYVAHAKAGEGR